MELDNILNIAKKAGIPDENLEPYGRYKAKIDVSFLKDEKPGKVILVTAITPTKAGEGKTTTSIGLADGFAKIGQKAMLCLREPALGPVFGIKGGATGGGKSTVEPSEDINLHFTGDMHALTSSINLISAVIDNHIFQGNELHIDPDRVVWRRALDMNDRALREITVGQGNKNGIERKDGFVITVASEMMAILCLAKDEKDFHRMLSRITVAYDYDGKPVTVADLRVTHAVMKLMKEALKPNLVQTAEGNPAIIHGGPFANIAHGCNSLIALEASRRLAPITVTEAGFGADLGAEKFLDILCPYGDFAPSMVVMVASARALKSHGGVPFADLEKENVEALKKGLENLGVHLENIGKYGLPCVVAINRFPSDTKAELEAIASYCEGKGVPSSLSEGFLKGGEGMKDLASKCLEVMKTKEAHFHPIVEKSMSLKQKIETIAREIYRADGVSYGEKAEEQLKKLEEDGYGDSYICMAKTPQSLSDNPKLVGVPKNFVIGVREVALSSGAGFVVPLTGDIMRMPGLPKVPAAVKMEDKPW